MRCGVSWSSPSLCLDWIEDRVVGSWALSNPSFKALRAAPYQQSSEESLGCIKGGALAKNGGLAVDRQVGRVEPSICSIGRIKSGILPAGGRPQPI